MKWFPLDGIPRARQGIPRQIRVTPWWRGFPHQPFVITSPFVTQKNKKFDALRQEDVIA
jgi:hypothetical protein